MIDDTGPLSAFPRAVCGAQRRVDSVRDFMCKRTDPGFERMRVG